MTGAGAGAGGGSNIQSLMPYLMAMNSVGSGLQDMGRARNGQSANTNPNLMRLMAMARMKNNSNNQTPMSPTLEPMNTNPYLTLGR